jgi:hypothetical protein
MVKSSYKQEDCTERAREPMTGPWLPISSYHPTNPSCSQLTQSWETKPHHLPQEDTSKSCYNGVLSGLIPPLPPFFQQTASYHSKGSKMCSHELDHFQQTRRAREGSAHIQAKGWVARIQMTGLWRRNWNSPPALPGHIWAAQGLWRPTFALGSPQAGL